MDSSGRGTGGTLRSVIWRGKALRGHQLPCALPLQVLLREPNPGVRFEFWLPRERYGPFQAQVQALGWPLRQPQPREVEPQPAEIPVIPEAIPARVTSLAPGEAGTTVRTVGVPGRRQGPSHSHTPPHPQTAAGHALTVVVAHTGFFTTVAAILVRPLSFDPFH